MHPCDRAATRGANVVTITALPRVLKDSTALYACLSPRNARVSHFASIRNGAQSVALEWQRASYLYTAIVHT